MKRVGESSWTNATHLVITDDAHPLAGQHLTAEALSGQTSEEPVYMVLTEQGELVPADNCDRAVLEVSQPVTLADGTTVNLKSSFLLLKESAQRFTGRIQRPLWCAGRNDCRTGENTNLIRPSGGGHFARRDDVR